MAAIADKMAVTADKATVDMLIKPMVRNNICINSHPVGCAVSVRRQIDYVQHNLKPHENTGPRLALIIGCSNGYGLASRIGAAFGYGAVTVGVSREKPATNTHTATPGFYHNSAFDQEAQRAGLVYATLDGNAFSGETKLQTIAAVKEAAYKAGIPAETDLLVYSLAAPVRVDPRTGIMHRSVIKPIGQPFSGTTLDMMSGIFKVSSIEPATEEEIAGTVKVMGGEDWELWMEALNREGLLSPQARVVAYTYLGPELSWPVYTNGTLGRAKADLERACREINKTYAQAGKIAGAWVSVNKALVTRSSAVIPIISLYIACLFRVMKDMGLHEGCIEQIVRLYRDRLYAPGCEAPAKVPVDKEGRIRIDDWEMRNDVQKAVTALMDTVTAENVFEKTDIAGAKHDFLEAHGFDVAGVDYTEKL